MTFKTFGLSVIAKYRFSKFVDNSCGLGTSSADTVYHISKKDIKPHLRGFNVIDLTLKSEVQLIFARAGIEPN